MNTKASHSTARSSGKMMLYEVAKTFSHYYHDNQILKAETKQLVVARVELSRMVLQLLKNAFAIVGIPFLAAM